MERNEEEKLLHDLFPGLNSGKIEEKPEEDEEIFLYIWKENKILFDIFQVLRSYLSEYYTIPTSLLVEMLKEEDLRIRENSLLISYIHYGYVSILVAKDKNGRENS